MKKGITAANTVTAPIDVWLGSLPSQPAALIGRAEELATARNQLLAPEVRLLTLVGPGGVGKTRLAVAVAESFRGSPAFSDGIQFVDLAPLPEPTLVAGAIARALNALTPEGGTALEAVIACLMERRVLLVLDNFEHLLGAAGQVATLLGACPGLVALTTSREPLRLRWERTLPLSPLAVPDPRHLPPLERLATIPAVALFLERARAAEPKFALTRDNAPAVAELCVRLDGLPLAIELVAARAAQLGPAATLDRLARRLPLPLSPMQDAPSRQQTLNATLEWSLDLLDYAERALFRRVAVFAGGWTLAAADAVAGGGDPDSDVPDVLRSLTSLVDKNLLLVDATSAEPRFRMLETAHEFALQLLDDRGESDAVRRRHATYFADLAEQAAPQLQGSGQAAVVVRLELEEDNFRQALRWTLDRGDDEALAQGLRLAGALGWYWFLHGYPAEAREWFQVLLRPSAGGKPTAVRARALNAAGFRATDHADYIAASTFHEEALATWRELDEMPGMVASLHGIGDTALWLGNAHKARAQYEAGLALAQARGTGEDVALFAFHLGQLWWLEGGLETAEEYGQQALTVARQTGSTTWPAYSLFVLASVAHERGDARQAGKRYREALDLAWQHHDRLCVRMALPGLAGLATLEGDPKRAVRLAGAANALEENAGIWAFPPIQARQEQWLATAQAALDDNARSSAWNDGRGMTLDEVIAYALEDAAAESASAVPDHSRLSRREREVLTLVAEGKSNREIATALIITENTAKYHVAQLLNKLGAGSRAEAVTRAVASGELTPVAE